MKNFSSNRGFTLIELMIVIVILGVLMGTILPRLTGAQARARDTGRVADLNSISQALETYYDDFGRYPASASTGECLVPGDDPTDPNVANELADYLKGGVPLPPSGGQLTSWTEGTSAGGDDYTPPCRGSYLYVSLENRGLNNSGYALLSDVETYQNANLDTNDLTPTLFTTSEFSAAVGLNTIDELRTAETESGGSELHTVYMIVN